MIDVTVQGSIWGIINQGRYINANKYIEFVVNDKGVITGSPDPEERKWVGQSIHQYIAYIRMPETPTAVL
jgi:hypothetical protein